MLNWKEFGVEITGRDWGRNYKMLR